LSLGLAPGLSPFISMNFLQARYNETVELLGAPNNGLQFEKGPTTAAGQQQRFATGAAMVNWILAKGFAASREGAVELSQLLFQRQVLRPAESRTASSAHCLYLSRSSTFSSSASSSHREMHFRFLRFISPLRNGFCGFILALPD